MKYFIYCFSLIVFSCFSSCELLELPGEEPNEDRASLIQFYVNQQKFNLVSRYVVASVTVNGFEYAPKVFIDNCTEMNVPPVTSSNNGREYFYYTINMKHYNSSDPSMLGGPFEWKFYNGIIYLDELETGCNTLEVKEGYGQSFVLGIK